MIALVLLACSQPWLPEPFDIASACPSYDGAGLGEFDRDEDGRLTRQDLDPGTAAVFFDVTTSSESFRMVHVATDGDFRPLPWEESKWGAAMSLACDPPGTVMLSMSDWEMGEEPMVTGLGVDFPEREVINHTWDGSATVSVDRDDSNAIASGEISGELSLTLEDLFRGETVAMVQVRHFAFHDIEVRP